MANDVQSLAAAVSTKHGKFKIMLKSRAVSSDRPMYALSTVIANVPTKKLHIW